MSSEGCSGEQRLCKSLVGWAGQGLRAEDTDLWRRQLLHGCFRPGEAGLFQALFSTAKWNNSCQSLNTHSLCIMPIPLLRYIQEDWDKEIYNKLYPRQEMQPPCKTGSYSWVPIELFLISIWVLSCFYDEAFPCLPLEKHTPDDSTDRLCILLCHEAVVCLYASVTKHLYFSICI